MRLPVLKHSQVSILTLNEKKAVVIMKVCFKILYREIGLPRTILELASGGWMMMLTGFNVMRMSFKWTGCYKREKQNIKEDNRKELGQDSREYRNGFIKTLAMLLAKLPRKVQHFELTG